MIKGGFTMKCKYCNYENKIGDRYCENCGAMLEDASGAMDDLFAASKAPAEPTTDQAQQGGGAQNIIAAVERIVHHAHGNHFEQPLGDLRPFSAIVFLCHW